MSQTDVSAGRPRARPVEPHAVARRRWPPRASTALTVAVLAIGFALPLRGLLRTQGPPMEEGFMLVFPEQVLKGRLPNRDFLHLYGPLSVWWLAAVYKVFGIRLVVERLAALTQMIGIVAAVTVLARRSSRVLALACGVLSLVIIVPPLGLTALAWDGGVALGMLGIVAGIGAIAAGAPRRAVALAFAAGLLLAGATLMRQDLVVAAGLAGLVVGRVLERVARRALVGGAALGLVGYVVHVATAGPRNVVRGMVLDPLIHLRGGRRLPVPPPPGHLSGFLQRAGDFGPFAKLRWPVPTLSSALQLFVWFFVLLAAVVVQLVAARRAWKRAPRTVYSVTLAAVALFSLGILPQAIQRDDSAHLAWVSCVAVAFVPVSIAELLRDRLSRTRWRGRADVVAAVAVIALFAVVLPRYTLNSYADATAQSFGVHRHAFAIRRGDRVFYYGKPEVADAAQHGVLPALDALSRRGDSLIVGTSDLRKTPYSDAYLYYLYPELRVGTYYIEMDPGVANARGSRLAGELRRADFVVLSSVWDDWSEPNDARHVGSDRPNQVVRAQLVCVGEYGHRDPTARSPVTFLYQLWARPATLAAHHETLKPGRRCTSGLARGR
jgi:hypothetical protein